jgi:hypothetical protein
MSDRDTWANPSPSQRIPLDVWAVLLALALAALVRLGWFPAISW